MHSFDTILRQHATILLLDAASASVRAGWVRRDQAPRWISINSEASSGIYAALTELDVSPNAADAFVFCEGPGSILGIRTVATALRTWVALHPRLVYSYRSLELVATAHGSPDLTAICDARRQSWHATGVEPDGSLRALQRVPTGDLPSSDLITPAGFRQWSATPQPPPSIVPYEPQRLTGDLSALPLFREAPEPDAFLHENPSFVQWTPAVHRAPNTSA